MRFAQPDTILPNPANPQSLNRFAYTLNNPIRYNDPTGHWVDEGCGVGDLCDLPEDEPPPPPPLEDEEKDILSLKDFLSHIPSDAVFWPTYTAFSNYSRRRRWSNNYFEPIYIPAGDGMYIVIMPPGQNPIVSRSEYLQQLGLDIGGFFGSRMDVVEGILV